MPDVPGCASIGHTLEELRENVHDELEFHLERMVLEGRAVQDPIMGMGDVAPDAHAEWMLVRPLPEKTLLRNAGVRQRLRRMLGLRWKMFSWSGESGRVRASWI